MTAWYVLLAATIVLLLALLINVLLMWWHKRKDTGWADPYPGEEALKEYVKSEYEHKPSHEGDQPKKD